MRRFLSRLPGNVKLNEKIPNYQKVIQQCPAIVMTQHADPILTTQLFQKIISDIR